MIEWLLFVIVMIMLAGALMAMLMENLLAATVAASIVSLGLTVIFVFLRAPDVAMTEAAVGAGLSSLILALGLKRLGLWKLDVPSTAVKADAQEDGKS
ncbi:MAG: DUF4040 domain-containing protein [Gammaproteobacteria bacterium]|nr:DUF4040 domain-containing protein [Gammaproteobacteria bacterium]NNJ90682.1 DUF4040 domain-containing protein [Gammaproteobacteria bacterium]